MAVKVKNLDKGTNLTKVKVKLPEDVLASYKKYYGGEPEMWIVGSLMGDFFLSPDAPTPDGKGKRSLFPMPVNVEPSDILEWEVSEVLKEK